MPLSGRCRHPVGKADPVTDDEAVELLLSIGCTAEHTLAVVYAWDSGDESNLTDTERATLEWLEGQLDDGCNGCGCSRDTYYDEDGE